MIEQHFEETKAQLVKLADEIFLDKEDLKFDSSVFAPLKQKVNNVVIFGHLMDLANNRLENLEVFINDKEVIENYRSDIVSFMRGLLRERI